VVGVEGLFELADGGPVGVLGVDGPRHVVDGEEKVILTALCGHGHLDLASYEAFLSGNLVDLDLDQSKIAAAMESVPVIA